MATKKKSQRTTRLKTWSSRVEPVPQGYFVIDKAQGRNSWSIEEFDSMAEAQQSVSDALEGGGIDDAGVWAIVKVVMAGRGNL